MTIDELYFKNKLSLRTCNICKKKKIISLEKILDYYYNFNTFIFINGVSEFSNLELINLCENHLKSIGKDLNEHNVKIILFFESLSNEEKIEFNNYFAEKINLLSFKSKSFLKNKVQLTASDMLYFLFDKNIFKENIESKKVLSELYQLRISLKFYLSS
jgi:hypothetical protein